MAKRHLRLSGACPKAKPLSLWFFAHNQKESHMKQDANSKGVKKMNKLVKTETIAPSVPEKKIRAGAISATVWRNHTIKDGMPTEYTTVSFERSYKDKQGNWQTTNSMRINDLPKATIVLQKAYEDLLLREFTDSPAI